MLAVFSVAVPVAVALAVQRQPAWHPLLDHAQTELRVRDVFSRHPPLVGLPGRLYGFGASGSHPGPLSFWAMAPAYRLLGADPWALQAAGACLHLLAAGVALWLAQRRGGTVVALAVGLVLAVLVHGYGLDLLTLPWNPYLPVLWWPAFLLAAWSVLCGDRPALPVAVVAGCFCAQTHVPYAGLVAGVGALVAGVLAARAVRTVRAERGRPAPPARQQTGGRWLALATALLVALWLPPLVEQLGNHPGNMAIIVETLRHPVEDRVAPGRALEAWLVQLDPVRLLAGRAGVEGKVLPGLAVLAAWLAAAVAAWRLRHAALVRLHLVLGVALAAGLASIARISGRLWDYLVLWGWGTTALVLLAVGWTAAVAARTWVPAAQAQAARTWARPALAAALVVAGVASTADAAGTEAPAPASSRVLGELATETAAALETSRGGEARYLINWVDPLVPGATGYGMLVELERRGLDVGLSGGHRTGARPFRTLAPGEATAEITIVAGPSLAEWRADPEAVEVASAGPTAAEAADSRRLRDRAIRLLRAGGAGEVVPLVDENLMAAAADPRTSDEALAVMQRMGDIPLPTAVFVTARSEPPDSPA